MTEDLEGGGGDPNEIREDVGTRIAPDVKVPEEVEESLRREREGEDEEVQGG